MRLSLRTTSVALALVCLSLTSASAQTTDPHPVEDRDSLHDDSPRVGSVHGAPVHDASAELVEDAAGHDATGEATDAEPLEDVSGTIELAPPGSDPDDPFFEPVGVANRFVLPSQRAPAGVTVITADQIARFGYRSVGEALAWVPGLFTSYDLVNHHVGARGLFGGSRSGSRNFRIMINGRPVAFVQHGTYLLGPEFVPVAAIERIEVMLGPASALYGAGALLGAINVVTRRPVYDGQLRGRATLRGDGGMLDQRTAGGEGVFSLTGDGWNVLGAVSGAWEDRSGLSMPDGPFAARNPGESEDDTAAPRSFLLSTDVAVGRGRLVAQLVGQQSDRTAEFYDLGALTHRTRIDVRQLFASVGYERAFGASQWIRLNVGYSHGGPGRRDQFDLRRSDGRLTTRDFSSNELSAQLEVLHEFGEGGLFSVGVDGLLDFEELARVDLVDPSNEQTTRGVRPESRTIADVGVYAQLLLPLVERLTLSAGARYDYHTVIEHAVSARLGAVAQLTERATLKIFAGRSYRAPSPEQLYANPLAPLDITGVPDAPAQYLNSVEGLVDVFLTRALRFSATAFYNYSDDALAYVSRAGRLEAVPFDAQSVGGEARARFARSFERVALDTSFAVALQRTWSEERFVAGFPEKTVPDDESFPTAMTWTSLQLRFLRSRIGLLAGWRFVGERIPSQSNLRAQGTTDLRFPGYVLPAYHLVEVGLTAGSYDLGASKLSFGIWLRNLLDERFVEVGFNGVDVPSIGRTLWFRAAVEL